MNTQEVQNQDVAFLAWKTLETLRQRHLNGSGATTVISTYKCQKCRDTGWEEIQKGDRNYAQECSCGLRKRQIMAEKIKFAEIPEEFKGQTIDSFQTDCYTTPQNKELAQMAKIIAKRYVEKFEEIQGTGKGLYFYSSVKGSGKTRLAAAIANDLICQKMITARFATTIQILDRIKASWGKGQHNEEQKLMNDIISAPVLVIDDIGTESVKDWIDERFYSILNGRMLKKNITIFTSNCKIENLKLDERIVNRIIKMALPIEFPDESIRLSLAGKENSDLLDHLLGK